MGFKCLLGLDSFRADSGNALCLLCKRAKDKEENVGGQTFAMTTFDRLAF